MMRLQDLPKVCGILRMAFYLWGQYNVDSFFPSYPRASKVAH